MSTRRSIWGIFERNQPLKLVESRTHKERSMKRAFFAFVLATGASTLGVAQTPAPRDSIYQAIRSNDLGALRALITKENIDAKDAAGLTPLVEAVAFGSPDAVRLLINAGANVQTASDAGITPLHVAWRDPSIARLLLDRGANVNAASAAGATPLFVAASANGTAPVVSLLLDRGARVDASENRGVTPLIAASSVGNSDVARLLIAHGANVNAQATQPGQKSDTPLMGAAYNGDIELARLILARKPDVHATSAPSDGTVKHGPVVYGSLTVLHHAVTSRNAAMVKLMLDAGASVDARDARGMTPLMWAIVTDRPELAIIKLLLDHGASLVVKTNDGETALDWARKFNDPAVLPLLKLTATRLAPPAAPASSSTSLSSSEAVSRGVTVLRTGAAGTMNEGGCVACHSHPVAAIAAHLAEARGVGKLAAADTADVVKTNRNGLAAFLIGREGGGEPDTHEYNAFMMAELNLPPSANTEALVYWLSAKQRTAGNWHGLATRAPIQDGDIGATAMGIRILTAYAAPARKAEYAERVKRAATWLAAQAPRSTQERVMQILGALWADPQANANASKRVRDLEALQAADGGWSQTPNLPADAYATGEVLYTLHTFGEPATAPAVRRGVAFLLATQAADGSWHVTSRAAKIQPYFESGFQYGPDQWISQSATAWATAALAVSAPDTATTQQ
jgi:ankyrin repeat protein